MYSFRYYAIGHSYLKHGPFVGWQTEGFWGMAASAPERDYFHKFCDLLKQNFDASVEAIAENQATYERLCTADATKEKYTSSAEYAHMRELILGFKPNIITVFVGGGNTVANDERSLSLFFDVLFEMIATAKLKETVVICVGLRPSVNLSMIPKTEKYGFTFVDTSFIHEKKGRDNPYYAFADYPEYDEAAANGAVEFRTHPNDKGHAAIARAIMKGAEREISRIPEGKFAGEYSYEKFVPSNRPERLTVKTEPEMTLSYYGFNVRQEGECVTFGSAPGTGASVVANGFSVKGCERLIAELEVEGATDSDELKITVGDGEYTLPIVAGMSSYELSLSDGEVSRLKIAPTARECVVRVKQIRLV